MTAALGISAALMAVGGYAAFVAGRLGVWEMGEPGPGLFPAIFGALLAGLGLMNALAGLRTAAPTVVPIVSVRRFVAYLAALVIYAVLLERLGFLLSTALAFALAMVVGERMRLGPAALVLGAAVAGSWLLFARLLSVPLPGGLLG